MNLHKKYLNVLLLISILAISLFLRIYKNDQVPNGFYVDESAIGYNAYSLLKTGKDEYGKSYPVFLRSFGAYSSPLYTYLTVLPVKIFGLNTFAVRLLSLLSGILAVILFYVLIRMLRIFKTEYSNLITTFLFGISPWGIFFSRGAFEASFSLTLTLAALLLVYYSTVKKGLSNAKYKIYFVAGFVLFALTSYSYQAHRLSSLIIIAGFVVLHFNKLRKVIKQVAFGVLVYFIIQLPQLILLSTPAFRSRAVGLFYSETIAGQSNKFAGILGEQPSYILAFLREFSAQALTYISPRNLFWQGDPDFQRSIPGMSVFHFWMVIPYFIGIYVLIKNIKKKEVKLLIILLVAFIVPAALTKDPFSTLRSLGLSVPLMIIIGFGIDALLNYRKRISVIFILIFSAFSLILFWRSYFILFPKERAVIWGYGISSLAEIIKKDRETHYILDSARVTPLYIQLAFFIQIDPREFHEYNSKHNNDEYYSSIDFDPNYNLANFETRPIIWREDIYKEQLLVGDSLAISEDQAKENYLKKVFEIKDPFNDVIFAGYKTDPAAKCLDIIEGDKLCNNRE